MVWQWASVRAACSPLSALVFSAVWAVEFSSQDFKTPHELYFLIVLSLLPALAGYEEKLDISQQPI